MDARQVLAFWTLAEEHGLEVCLDGGWAVDALLGQQTRAHGDLDIALPAAKGQALRALLGARGFAEGAQPDSREHNFVLVHPDGAVIDVHSYVLNADGSNGGGVPYVAEHLTGTGLILGQTVRCVPPGYLVEFHTGYAVDETDWHDVRLLCERFDLPVPRVFAPFRSDESKP